LHFSPNSTALLANSVTLVEDVGTILSPTPSSSLPLFAIINPPYRLQRDLSAIAEPLVEGRGENCEIWRRFLAAVRIKDALVFSERRRCRRRSIVIVCRRRRRRRPVLL